MTDPARIFRKLPKAEVRYRARPNGLAWCGNCDMFRGPADCTSVESPISPDGWCQIHAPADPDAMGQG
jgi:hypothetical protein